MDNEGLKVPISLADYNEERCYLLLLIRLEKIRYLGTPGIYLCCEHSISLLNLPCPTCLLTWFTDFCWHLILYLLPTQCILFTILAENDHDTALHAISAIVCTDKQVCIILCDVNLGNQPKTLRHIVYSGN